MKKLNWYILSLLSLILIFPSCKGNSESSENENAGQENQVAPATRANEVPGLEQYEAAEGATDNVLTLQQALDAGLFKVADNIIFSENLPVVVDFYADWCGPCKAYSPVFHKVAGEFGGMALFVSIDTEKYPELAESYKVSSIPCTVFIGTEGSVLGKVKGAISEQQLAEYVNQLIDTSEGDNMSL